jgi:hypothetical protein
MTTDEPQDETPREQLAKEAAEAYTELTQQADDLPPERAQAILRVRDFMTSFAAYYAAMDRRLVDQEQITDLFMGHDVALLAELLCTRLTAEQRGELARLITKP